MRTFLDIETLPAPEDDLWAAMSAYERKRKRMVEYGEKPPPFEKFREQTALNGDFGRVCVIALAHGDKMAPGSAYGDDEKSILKWFWEQVAGTKQFVGHNILSFDLPFIIKRSRIHGIEPSQSIYLGKFKQHPVYDTMEEWGSWGRDRTSLDVLCKILHIETPKGDIDGSQVAKAWEGGRRDDVVEYCKRDVEAVRKVWRRMEFKDEVPSDD